MWSYVALIVGSGVILGITGGFGAIGFLVAHIAVLCVLMFGRRRVLASDCAALRAAAEQALQFFRTPGIERMLGGALVTILMGLTVIAALAEPAIVDAVMYHLPRIGHWLQDGKIQILASADARMNFVAVLPEIMMAWLLGATREGFKLVVVAQAIGGIMTIGATIGLARQSGLGRAPALLAGALLLGMANVVSQFTAAQTDLYTTGVFSASFYLWLAALRRGESSIPGAMGAGMALGAKGTLFYLAPGAMLWVVWLASRYRLSWSHWRRTGVATMLGFGLFALPGFVRNWQAYGNALGPAEWVKMVQPTFDSVSGQLHKLYWNLTSYLAQNFDPQSQPYGLHRISREMAESLIHHLPEADPYTLVDIDRRAKLTAIIQNSSPDPDMIAFGVAPLFLFSLGTLAAIIKRRRSSARLVLVWSGGVMMFFLFFSVKQQWHPFAFRYFVLVSPWVAVVGAWAIEQVSRQLRPIAWAIIVAMTLNVGWAITMHANQSGWLTVAHPKLAPGYYLTSSWRDWSQQLDHPGEPFRLALSASRPIAAFYRQWPPRQIIFKPDPGPSVVTAEDFVRGESGWVIVPAKRFLGHEGKVAASIWLAEGDAKNDFSVAAYRPLDPDEKPQSLIYRLRRTEKQTSVSYDLLVKTVSDQPVSLTFTNPAKSAYEYVWHTPSAEGKGIIPAAETLSVEPPLPSDGIGKVTIVFDAINGLAGESTLPTVKVLVINPKDK